ncbi:GNAT family N-acetyltransferase [Nonomuraea sp. NPDC050328]|uniref:GNAT family N-acetyltransferase n=1 Tax=Nonomuraea sp. NPDC050328 TaxID=3364361 RepID=UPI0037962555
MEMRRLTPDELDDCVRLAKSREWLPERRKWALLFEAGEVYGLLLGGTLVSTTVLTRYGAGYGVISMVLTDPAHARQGLARRLMEYVLEQADGLVLSLTATPNGRPLYERLGFETVGEVTSHVGVFAGEPSGVSRAATAADLEPILALDRELFEADRGVLLRRLPDLHDPLRVIERDGRVAAFGGVWDTGDQLVGGPVVTRDPEAAMALLADLLAGTAKPVRLDLDTRQTEVCAWAEAHGVQPGFSTKLMVRGGALPGVRPSLVTSYNVALG